MGERGVVIGGWSGEASARKQPREADLKQQFLSLSSSDQQLEGLEKATGRPQLAEAVSLWQLAVTSTRPTEAKANITDLKGLSDPDNIVHVRHQWPPLMDLISQARSASHATRSGWVSGWLINRILIWQGMGRRGAKMQRWELMKARLLAGAENGGVLKEAKARGCNHAFILNASRCPLNPTSLKMREQLVHHCALQEELDQLWGKLPKSVGAGLSRPVYMWMMRRIIRVLLPDATPAETTILLLRDWEVDAANEEEMDRSQFERCFFSLVLVWCESPGVAEVAEFMRAMHRVVMDEGLRGHQPHHFISDEVTSTALRHAVDTLLRPQHQGSQYQMPSHHDLATASVVGLLLNPDPTATADGLFQVTGGFIDPLKAKTICTPPRSSSKAPGEQDGVVLRPTQYPKKKERVPRLLRPTVRKPRDQFNKIVLRAKEKKEEPAKLEVLWRLKREAEARNSKAGEDGEEVEEEPTVWEEEEEEEDKDEESVTSVANARWSCASIVSSSSSLYGERAQKDHNDPYNFAFRTRDAPMRDIRFREHGKVRVALPPLPLSHENLRTAGERVRLGVTRPFELPVMYGMHSTPSECSLCVREQETWELADSSAQSNDGDGAKEIILRSMPELGMRFPRLQLSRDSPNTVDRSTRTGLQARTSPPNSTLVLAPLPK